MADKPIKPLAPVPQLQAHKPSPGSAVVLSRIVSDALSLAKSSKMAMANDLIKVGKYEFNKQSYQMLSDWVNAYPRLWVQRPREAASYKIIDVEGLVEYIDDNWLGNQGQHKEEWEDYYDGFEAGSVVGLFPLESWVSGGYIVGLTGLTDNVCSPDGLDFAKAPKLKWFDCRNGRQTEILDLSCMTSLTKLWCNDNDICQLDLSHTPHLEELSCSDNQLIELDLSHTPLLELLDCGDNLITELDLSHTPKLNVLSCSGHHLTELNLSHTPHLKVLHVFDSQLKQLDLSHTHQLKALMIGSNQLTELDLSCTPSIEVLYISHCQLVELDLSHTPDLKVLQIFDLQLNKLDLSPVPGLTRLHCDEGVHLLNAPRGLKISGMTKL